MRCAASAAAIRAEAGVASTAKILSSAWLTSAAVPAPPAAVALIVTRPAACAVTRPSPSTLATVGSLDDQLTAPGACIASSAAASPALKLRREGSTLKAKVAGAGLGPGPGAGEPPSPPSPSPPPPHALSTASSAAAQYRRDRRDTRARAFATSFASIRSSPWLDSGRGIRGVHQG
jgi:hypothetical protein